MIASKHCDLCDVELPPWAFFPAYDCADMALHPNHPHEKSSAVRVTASPAYLNTDSTIRPDICPECFEKLVEKLLRKVQSTKRRVAAQAKQWHVKRQASPKKGMIRNEEESLG